MAQSLRYSKSWLSALARRIWLRRPKPVFQSQFFNGNFDDGSVSPALLYRNGFNACQVFFGKPIRPGLFLVPVF